MRDYQALLKMSRPVHAGDDFFRRHPKMARGQRAKLFAPFDALSGFDETMDAETVLTEHPAELSEEMKGEINEKLQLLLRKLNDMPRKMYERKGLLTISVLYFEEDLAQEVLHNDGVRGNYRWISGEVLDIDLIQKTLKLSSRVLRFEYIYAIEGINGEMNSGEQN